MTPGRPATLAPDQGAPGVRKRSFSDGLPTRPEPRSTLETESVPSRWAVGLVVWYKMGVRIARSARRHGVGDQAIRHAVTTAIRLVATDDGVFVIGADDSGRMLELVARTTDDDLVVFHAMPLRPVNAKRYLP